MDACDRKAQASVGMEGNYVGLSAPDLFFPIVAFPDSALTATLRKTCAAAASPKLAVTTIAEPNPAQFKPVTPACSG